MNDFLKWQTTTILLNIVFKQGERKYYKPYGESLSSENNVSAFFLFLFIAPVVINIVT